MVDCALTEDVDLVLLAGDADKGRDPSQTHQREFATRLASLSNAGIPSGPAGRQPRPAQRGEQGHGGGDFPDTPTPRVTITDRLQNYVVHTKTGDLQALAVPWPRRSGILSREESKGLTIMEVRDAIQDRMTAAISREITGDNRRTRVPARNWSQCKRFGCT